MGSLPGNKRQVVVQVETGTLPHTKEGVLNTCVSVLQSNLALQTFDTLLLWTPRQLAKSYSHQGTLEEYNGTQKEGIYSKQWIELGVGWPFPRK